MSKKQKSVTKPTTATTASNLDVALSLADRGWSVFPVKPDGSKTPYRGILWADAATTDAEQIATWFASEFPSALVGLAAGKSGLVIVDVDEKPAEGKTGHANLAADGYDIPATIHYTTPSGGAHYVFTAPAGERLTVAQNHPVLGVDIRSGNGYVAYYGPPLTSHDDVAPAPEWALKRSELATTSSGAPASDIGLDDWIDRLADGKPSKKVKKALGAVTRNGMGHDTMLEAVTRLVQLGSDGEPGVATALADAEATYTADYPEHRKAWRDAVSGSIRHAISVGNLPPRTIALSKAEKKAIRATPKARPAAADVDPALTIDDGPLALEICGALRDEWAWTLTTSFIRYRDHVWTEAPEQSLVEAVRARLASLEIVLHRQAVERDDKGGIKQAMTLLSRTRIRAVADLVKGLLMEDQRETDSHPDLLNCPNGYVDLTTGELHPHDPSLLFTKITGCDYDPAATNADWEKALEALTPATRDWMQVRFGQAITGRMPEDAVVPFLIGGGENGKSAVFNGVRSAAGNYAVTVPDKLLLANPGDHPTEMMTLHGARLAIVEELPEGRQLNTKRLKDIAGTPRISARRMRQDFVEFDATHSLFVSANQTPIVTEVDHGTWRRLCVVPFRYKFVKPGVALKGKWQRTMDEGLRDRLGEDPHPAALAWLVAGAMRWYANGRTMTAWPAEVAKTTKRWRHDADPVMQFVDEELELHEGSAIWVMDMLAEFNAWQESQGLQKWNARTIAARFAGHESLPGVEKKFVKFGLATVASRPMFTTKLVAPRAEAWKGVRFKRANPDTPAPDPQFESVVRGI